MNEGNIPLDAKVPKEKYREIIMLEKMLRELKIPYMMERAYDGYHIGIPMLSGQQGMGGQNVSIVEHRFSYGSDNDLLEMWTKGVGTRGWLTAMEALRLYSGDKEAMENGKRKREERRLEDQRRQLAAEQEGGAGENSDSPAAALPDDDPGATG